VESLNLSILDIGTPAKKDGPSTGDADPVISVKSLPINNGGVASICYCAKAPKSERLSLNGVSHPTQKPLALMRYLVKLITPPGGIILDPFAGSGSTGVAALQEGFLFVGIEQNKEYVDIAERRLEAA